jgi:5'-nucleotidase
VVAAPASQASGTGAGLTAVTEDHKVIVARQPLPGLPDVPAYALAAHPALITLVGCHQGFGPRPAIVLSGVNRGPNLGTGVLHSGTVGAALTAGVNRARAMAVSLDVEDEPDPHWEAAAAVAANLLPALTGLPPGTVLNVNVPNVPVAELPPPRWAGLSTYGRAQFGINRLGDSAVELRTVIVDGDLEPGTDAALLAEGHPTVTALHSVHAADDQMTGDLGGVVEPGHPARR